MGGKKDLLPIKLCSANTSMLGACFNKNSAPIIIDHDCKLEVKVIFRAVDTMLINWLKSAPDDCFDLKKFPGWKIFRKHW